MYEVKYIHSSFEVLEAINSKTVAEAKAAKERESRAREMALKALAAKEALLQRLRATSTTTPRPTTVAAPIPEESLVDRRKALFTQRATTERPKLPKGKAAVLTAEQVRCRIQVKCCHKDDHLKNVNPFPQQVKKQQILDEIRKNKHSPRPKQTVKSLSPKPRVSSLTERLRPSLSIKSSPHNPIGNHHRRPKTVTDLLRSSQGGLH